MSQDLTYLWDWPHRYQLYDYLQRIERERKEKAMEDLNVINMPASEADRAADLRHRADDLLKQLCVVMDEGMRQGLLIQFNGVGVSPMTGRHEVIDLRVVKRF